MCVVHISKNKILPLWELFKKKSIIKSPPVLTQTQKNALDGYVRGIDPENDNDLDSILKSYYSASSYPTPPPSLSEKIQNYARKSEEMIKWLIKKTIAATLLVGNYSKLRQQCDLLSPMITNLRLGDVDLVACQTVGKTAIALRATVQEQLKSWFSCQPPYHKSTPADNTQLMASYFQGATFEAELSLQSLNEWKRNGRLHLQLSAFVPLSTDSWDGLRICSGEIDDFFTTISSFNMSPSAVAA